ncbi:MAG: hypothetical protein RR224_05100, partial [Clostridia bacterium]
LQEISTHNGWSAVLCFSIGGFSGYPTGARLSRLLGRETLAPFCNLCSPIFLLSVVSIGMYGNAAMFAPLAIAHYGTALLSLLIHFLFSEQEDSSVTGLNPIKGSIISDIGDSMFAMIRIGGCILFFYVASQLIEHLIFGTSYPLLQVLFTGIFEVTIGCSNAVQLHFPPRVTAGLLAFFVSFGGLSIFSQAMLVAELKQPLKYLFWKTVQAFSAALIAYFITPLFIHNTMPVLQNAAEIYAQNSLTCFAFFAAACLGLVGSYLFAQITHHIKKVHSA